MDYNRPKPKARGPSYATWFFLGTVSVSLVVAYKSERFRKLRSGFDSFVDACFIWGKLFSVLSSDVSDYLLTSEENAEIPSSLKQLLKLLQSSETQEVAQSTVASALRGAFSAASTVEYKSNVNFEELLDSLLTPKTTGFVSSLLGSCVRKSMEAYFEALEASARRTGSLGTSTSTPFSSPQSLSTRRTPPDAAYQVLELLASDKSRRLLTDLVSTFVSSSITVYLDKTKDVNMTDDALTSLAKPAHRAVFSEVAGSVMGDAVRASVQACHEVMTSPPPPPPPPLGSSPSYLNHHSSLPPPPSSPSFSSSSFIALHSPAPSCHNLTRARRHSDTERKTPPPSQPHKDVEGGGGVYGGQMNSLHMYTPGTQSICRRLPMTQRPMNPRTNDSRRAAPLGHVTEGAENRTSPGSMDEESSQNSRSSSEAVDNALRILGAPEVRMLVREVVKSTVWGGTRALMDCTKEMIPTIVPTGSWVTVSPVVVLSTTMAVCLHVGGMVY